MGESLGASTALSTTPSLKMALIPSAGRRRVKKTLRVKQGQLRVHKLIRFKGINAMRKVYYSQFMLVNDAEIELPAKLKAQVKVRICEC